MKENKKTNAARLLDQKGIAYELIAYPVDENDLGAEHIAESLQEPIERVFKTILVRGDKTGPIIGVVPGNLEIVLKSLAKASQNKSVETVPLKELQPLTGYIRGGCSPIGLKKPFPIFIHETALQFDFIYVSAGVRGMQLKISPKDLIQTVHATFAAIAGPKTEKGKY